MLLPESFVLQVQFVSIASIESSQVSGFPPHLTPVESVPGATQKFVPTKQVCAILPDLFHSLLPLLLYTLNSCIPQQIHLLQVP